MIRIVMLLFKYVFDKNFTDKLPDIFSLLKDLSKKETGLQYIESLVKYTLSNVENITTNELISKIENTLPEKKGGLIMTLTEQLRNEGREQGIEQGLEFAIDMKFSDTTDTKSAISIIKNINQLKAIQQSIKKAKTASELIRLINN